MMLTRMLSRIGGLSAILLPAIALGATAAMIGTAPAQSPQQSPCAPYEIIAASLNERYHEAPVARMLADQGFVIEVLASADGATFTVLGVQPNGTACLLATGSGFAAIDASAAPAPGTKS